MPKTKREPVTFEMAEQALNDFVSDDCLKEFERTYNNELAKGELSDNTRFQYAWCLVRSRLNPDVRRGIVILEELLASAEAQNDKQHRRDYLYYLAVAYTRLREHEKAERFIKSLLQQEPGNRQAQELEKIISQRKNSDAMTGAAILGGGALVAGGLVALGISLLKR